MSADNMILLRKFPDGWRFVEITASGEYSDSRVPNSEYHRSCPDGFESMEDCVAAASRRFTYTEYGFRIDEDGPDEPVSVEQEARDMLERMGIEDAQSFSAGDLAELANLIDEVRRWRKS